MAFPAIESINPAADNNTGGAATSGSTAATSHSVVLPATVTAGSLLMMFGRVASAGAVAVTGGGWTISQDSSDASDDVSFWAYRNALAAGTEDGSSITVTHGNFKMCATTISVTGAEDPAVQAPQASTIAVGTGSGTIPNSLTPTGGAKDYLWLFHACWDGEAALGLSAPANYTDRPDVGSGTGGAAATNCQMKIGDRQLNAASTTPGGLAEVPNSAWTEWTLAVHPAAPVAPTFAPPLPVTARSYRHMVVR